MNPLQGWAASSGTLNGHSMLLAWVLFAWQYPHFNALSWNLRGDYSKGGYRMASVLEPVANVRQALQFSAVGSHS